jgi:hypothetical protein
MSIRKFSIEELSKDEQKLFNVLNDESDFAVVLISASYLDTSLLSILHNYLKNSKITDKILDSNNGILGTFSSRLDIAYCLDIIDKKTYQDLTIIMNIRNKFAHSHLKVDFKNEEIAKLCEQFHFYNMRLTDNKGHELDKNNGPLLFSSKNPPRIKFIVTVSLIVNILLIRGLEIKRKS